MRVAYDGSVRRAAHPGVGKRAGVPKEFVEEAVHGSNRNFARDAVVADRLADSRNRENAWNARHPKLGQGHSELHRGSHAAKAAGKLRTEGRDYIMRPGDIVEFRFNVSK